ncbi:MAG: hypothetical protein JWL64_1408, partial [Frankiales bacterium]|nr:hypothetical protein [Frankiales bacterium]
MPEQSGPAWEPPGWATGVPDQPPSAPAPGGTAPPA